jgi:hypothetical protein
MTRTWGELTEMFQSSQGFERTQSFIGFVRYERQDHSLGSNTNGLAGPGSAIV